MECVQNSSQWATAIPTITNALIAALVALGVTWLTHRFTERREVRKISADRDSARRALLRDKAEQMTWLIRQHYECSARDTSDLGAMLLSWVHGQPHKAHEVSGRASDAYAQAEAIFRLYFPAFAKEFMAIDAANSACATFRSDEIRAAIANLADWKENGRATFVARSMSSVTALHSAYLALAVKAGSAIQSELATPPAGHV